MLSREEIGMHFQEALNDDLAQSCRNFEKNISLAEQGFEFTDNSAYFLMQFTDQLRFAVYMALDAAEKSELLAAGKTLAVGAVQAGAGNYLIGDSKARIVFQGVNAVLTTSLTLKQMNDISQTKNRAEKILTFLGDSSKKAPGKIINRIAIGFWQKFRLHIELLKKGKTGSDILIEYLTRQIVNSIMNAPKSMLSTGVEETLNYIHKEIMHGENGIFSKSIPKTKMQIHSGDLYWNLRELIQHSPRIRLESYSMPGSSLPLFKVETYYCELEKLRTLKKVDADDSHKYPSVMIIAQSELDRLPNFRLDKKYELELPSDSKRNKNKYLIRTNLYCNLYKKARNVKGRRDSSNVTYDLIELMCYFNLLSQSLLNSVNNLRRASWLWAVVEMMNLVNVYDKYIDNTIKNKPYLKSQYKINKRFVNLVVCSRENANLMENLFKAPEKSIVKRIEGVKLKSQFFKNAEVVPNVKLKEVDTNQYAIFQVPEETKMWLELDYSQDDNVLVRHDKCRITENLKSILGMIYSFDNLQGERVSGTILSNENCDNYNVLLTQYFSSMQTKDYITAFYALKDAIYYFTFGIDDQMVFIQKDMGLIEKIKTMCDGLLNEYNSVVDEIFNAGGIAHLKGYSKELGHDKALKMSIILKLSLEETKKLYDTCKEIRDDKSLQESFSEISTKGKIVVGIAGGILIGAALYFGYHAVKSRPEKNENMNNNNDGTPKAQDVVSSKKSSMIPDASTLKGLTGTIIATGIVTGGIIVANDAYSKSMATKRVIKKMYSENSPLDRWVKNPKAVLAEKVHSTMSSAQKPLLPGLNYQSLAKEGHCLYQAVGLYCGEDQNWLRGMVAAHLEHNLDAFREFLTPLLKSGQTMENYLGDVRVGREWADHIEIEVLMRVLDRPIFVIGPDHKIRNPEDRDCFSGEFIFVYYNGHNHYDGLLLTGEMRSTDIFSQLIKPKDEAQVRLTQLSEHSLLAKQYSETAEPVRPNDLTDHKSGNDERPNQENAQFKPVL